MSMKGKNSQILGVKIEICKYCYFVGSGDKLGEVSAEI